MAYLKNGKQVEGTMSTAEAIHQLGVLSYGTLCVLTGLNTYRQIDSVLEKVIDVLKEKDLSACETWQDIWNLCYDPSFASAVCV